MKGKVLTLETTTEVSGNHTTTSITYDTGYRTPNGEPIIGWSWCSSPGIQFARKKDDHTIDPDSCSES